MKNKKMHLYKRILVTGGAGFLGSFHYERFLENDEKFSILKLAHKIIELTGSKSRIVYKETPVDDPIQRKPDISLAKKHLKWQPKTGLELGLKRTIEYFNNFL